MIYPIISQYNFNLTWAKILVDDLSEEQMTFTPSTGLENHPAFTLGHLVTASSLLAKSLGGEKEIPEGWAEIFQRKGPGDPRLPEKERELYPSKRILLAELEKQHDKVIHLLTSNDKLKLGDPITWRFSKYLPTYFDLVTFMCISHEAMHLGQLSAWRRAMQLPSALAAL